MRKRLQVVVPVLLAPLLCGAKEPSARIVVPLEEVSTFELPQWAYRFVGGQRVDSGDTADPEVKAYPAFTSGKPIYGSFRYAREYRKKDSGILYYFAIDESGGTGTGYDRLYFDLNRDLDLTNDRPLTPHKEPPEGATSR